jgi:hypothetical protein
MSVGVLLGVNRFYLRFNGIGCVIRRVSNNGILIIWGIVISGGIGMMILMMSLGLSEQKRGGCIYE